MKKYQIVIAGASGFIGKNLIAALRNHPHYQIRALSRKTHISNQKQDNIEWKKCDGFNYEEVLQATKDCDILIYLIHSMLPTAGFIQGGFEDFDLIMADNFSRAVKTNNISYTIYLSGLIPKLPIQELSKHLRSRLEVEHVLSQFNNATTTLRAGLIIGNNGSSYKILEKLIKRLPILLCPLWTQNKMHPIALKNVIEIFRYCLDHLDLIKNKTFDIGTIKPTSYRDLLQTTAKIFKVKRLFIPIPFLNTSLSKFWVKIITGAPKELVFPLVSSLEHEMLVDDQKRLNIPNMKILNEEESLIECVKNKTDHVVQDHKLQFSNSKRRDVISIQRIPDQINISAHQLANSYIQWLKTQFKFLINIKEDLESVSFLLLNRFVLIRLYKNIKDTNDCYRYEIESGLLVSRFNKSGFFEFRNIPSIKCFIIGIYNYHPSLPWYIYRYTQAIIHLFVMKKFIEWTEKNHL